jgi:uncharacterized protein YuzE
MHIWLRKAKYDVSEELAGNVVIDLDKNGRIIGIEVIDVSKNREEELVTKILNTEKTAATAKSRRGKLGRSASVQET